MIIYSISICILIIIGYTNKQQQLLKKHGAYTWYISNALYILCKYIPEGKEVNRNLRILYNNKERKLLLKQHLAIKISSSILFTLISIIIVTTFSHYGVIEIILIIGSPILGFLLPEWEVNQKVDKERDILLIDFEKFTYQLSLYVSCGLSIYQACKRAVENKRDSQFYKGINKVISQTESGEMFLISLYQLSASLMSHEVTTLVTLLEKNAQYGGSIKDELAKFSLTLQNKRSLQAIKEGEKASVKMVFPLTLGLVGVLLILITPAILLIKQL